MEIEKITKEKFSAPKRLIKICDVNVNNIVISKLVKTKTNSKYLNGYLDKTIRKLVLIMPKMSRYVKTFGVKDGNDKLMSFRIDDDKLLEKHKAIWTEIGDFKNIKLNALPACDDRYIKTKIRTFGDKEQFYTNSRDLNIPEDGIDANPLLSRWYRCESFTVISIDSLFVYDMKYYLQVYLNSCTYKVVNKQMTDYLDENLFKD